jgi:hypothetical protein
MHFYNACIYIKNKLIIGCFIACAFASIVVWDALNALLGSLAIMEVQSKEKVLILLVE